MMLVNGIIVGGPIGIAPYIILAITLPIIGIFAGSRLWARKERKEMLSGKHKLHSAAA
jgi:hypothetical protein